MSIDSVGYVDYFNAKIPTGNRGEHQVASQQKRNINPFTDKVYVDYQTGEYTTWKPGLRTPENSNGQKVAAATVGILGTLATIALAIVFRGKIKGGATSLINTVKPYIPKGIKSVAKNAITHVKDWYKAAKSYVPKGVKKFLKDAYGFVKKYIDAGAKFVKKYTYDPIKKLFTSSTATPTP